MVIQRSVSSAEKVGSDAGRHVPAETKHMPSRKVRKHSGYFDDVRGRQTVASMNR